MKKILASVAFSLAFLLAYAQSDSLRLLRIETLPYYSFGKGVGITSPDSLYQLNIRFRMQSRATFNDDNGTSSIDAQVRRLRLRFDGYVGSPKFGYTIQLSFAPGDVGSLVSGENLNIIRDAVIWYRPSNHWALGFGQTKLPGNRQRLNSSGALELTDRSINNAQFNIDRDFGFQAQRLNMYKNKFSYKILAAISSGEGRNYTKNDDMDLAYTTKAELYPFGAFSSQGEYFEGDIKREARPKLMLSAAFQYNAGAKRTGGQLGSALYEKKNIQSFLADALLKYQGWAIMCAFMNRGTTSDPIAYNPLAPSDFNYVYVGNGLDIQGSYTTLGHWAIIGRYSYKKADAAIHAYEPHVRQFSLGLTKYVWEHNFKLQTEITHDKQILFDGTNTRDWYARFQIEIGI
jgi:phosphate-selective porin OprO/OprP